ncbi:plasmid pRiA4b ORF-3 family protein [Mangrovibacterium lignilyticum]|uniref:plasmid pRiA4b ORF-3 family protein n=1 Tax=Mangrovibacterium lignilyticum TaxID=2668052 RepID=UPI0013D07BBC|nr:plasmid pRiA4b ORF-3 family protein [Mangrovibacterium lignilyticum]
MVYQFKITTTEIPDYILIVELDGKHTFADLHICIQQACGFNPDQLASFFIAGTKCGRQIEITQLDLGFDGINQFIMKRTPLQALLNHENQKMLYVFDFFMDRLFFIELTLIFMGKSLSEPSVTFKKGNAPSQLLEEEELLTQESEVKNQEECLDYGDLDDYTEIFGEMEDLTGGL